MHYRSTSIHAFHSNLKHLATLICLILLASPASIAAEPDPWADFLEWWPGTYNNMAQVNAQKAGAEPDKANTAQRLFIRRVDLPAFGDDVFYAEWQAYDDPTNIMRQRFYAMENEGGVQRLNLHIFPNDAAFRDRTVGAHLDPSKLSGITPADMVDLKGCDVFFEWQNDHFAGAMKKQECAFPAPDGTPIYSWSQMRLKPSAFEYLDGWFNTDDSVYQRLAYHWYVFEKADDPSE